MTIKERREETKECLDAPESSENEKINARFVLRNIMVSLIFLDEPGASDEYIKSMLKDDSISDMNRAFHLEYYGDIPYKPQDEYFDQKDKLDEGKKTLRHLTHLTKNIVNTGEYAPFFELSLFTTCSLLQARIETHEVKFKFKIIRSVLSVIDIVKIYLATNHCKGEIRLYFESVLSDFEEWKKCLRYHKTHQLTSVRLCNTYSEANTIKRKEWKIHGIERPENIVEHMYDCWLMGLFMLPEKVVREDDYSKQKVLNMLLIHNLGKTNKSKDDDEAEDKEMRKLFLKGTYPKMPNLTDFMDLWDEWKKGKSYNARVALEIDKIQAMYRLYSYRLDNRNNFTDAEVSERLENCIKMVTTPTGKDILKNVLELNSKF